MPGALQAFWNFSQTCKDAWIYGSYQTVDNFGNIIEEIHREEMVIFCFISSRWRHTFSNIHSLFETIPTSGRVWSKSSDYWVEDRDLGRMFALKNTVAHIPFIITRIRIGEIGSTTNWAKTAEGDRICREKALNSFNAVPRIIASANTYYWKGRVCRSLLGSILWNCRNKKYSIICDRFSLFFRLSGKNFLNSRFWSGVKGKRPCE